MQKGGAVTDLVCPPVPYLLFIADIIYDRHPAMLLPPESAHGELCGAR